MQLGKVRPVILERYVFPFLGSSSQDIIIGPAVGEDAAVIANGAHFLVISSDPITGVAESIGRYAVDINANDVATMGAEPRFMTLTVILPPYTNEDDLRGITSEAHAEASRLGISIVGGHTEVTDLIEKPILVGSMVGFTKRLLSHEQIQAGDRIILTKGAGIEGTSILARTYAGELKRRGVDEQILEEARCFSKQLAVVKEALLARDLCRYMHDPTEGGILGGLHELCGRAGVGFAVDKEKILVLPTTQIICAALSVDPLKLIGSGALLIVVSSDRADQLLAKLEGEGIEARCIGNITEGGRNLPPVEQDELWRLAERG